MRSRTSRTGNQWLPWVILALLFALAAIEACGPATRSLGGDPYQGLRDPNGCPTVRVRNQTWFDVVVYQTDPRVRVGSVPSQGEKTMELCGAVGSPSVLVGEPIGSRESWPVRGQGHGTFGRGDRWELQFSPLAASQYLISRRAGREGAGFGGPLEDFYVIGARRVTSPYATWVGIYLDVQACLGQPVEEPTVEWYVADYLVDMEVGLLTYGVTEFTSEGEARAVYIDKEYIFHATVVSHEAVHVMTGMEEPGRCVMRVPGGGLGERPIPDEVMERVRG